MSFFKDLQFSINSYSIDINELSTDYLLEKEKEKLNISFKESKGGSSLNYEGEDNTFSFSSDGIIILSPKSKNKEEKKIEKETKDYNKNNSKPHISNEELIKKIRININKEKKITKVILVIEVFLGFLLSNLSGLIFYLSFKFSSSGQKIIAMSIELIIIPISFYGIFPKKSSSHKKILISLYLWISLFLIPISFFSESGIKDNKILIIYHDILIFRLIFILNQEILFFISLLINIKI